MSLKDPRMAEDVVDRWLAAPGPAMLEAIVDALEAPTAKVKPEQALHFVESLVRGKENAMKIAKTIFQDKVREMI